MKSTKENTMKYDVVYTAPNGYNTTALSVDGRRLTIENDRLMMDIVHPVVKRRVVTPADDNLIWSQRIELVNA
jgi:hypothetical protein